MAIQGEGLSFYPLHWVYHDQWKYWREVNFNYEEYHHYGHVHLFMLGFPWGEQQAGQDAFSGQMQFRFEMKDLWGPRSEDPNQRHQYTVVGTPKWYFRITEVWRRAYIQPWDLGIQTDNYLEKRGIRYDASPVNGHDGKVHGPFREGRDSATGRDFMPVFFTHGRTMPIDYHAEAGLGQDTRQNQLYELAQNQMWQHAEFLAALPDETRTVQEIYDEIHVPEQWDLNHGNWLSGGGFQTPAHPAAVGPWPDSLYIWPILEYQTVVPVDWAILPGNDPIDYDDPYDVSDDFGDGWVQGVTVPFKDPATGNYRSPFGPSPGTVYPPGDYFNEDYHTNPLVPMANRLRYPEVGYCPRPHEEGYSPECDNYYNPPFDQPPETSGELLQWHQPYAEHDGLWVQQCLGGKVEAKAKVCIEHRLGGREFVWTHVIQYLPGTPFSGSDNFQPPTG